MTQTIFEAYNTCKAELQKAGIKDEVFESKQIIKYVTGYSNAQILSHYNDRLTEFQQNNLTAIKKQRIIHYPLQYIFGKWDFYGREFAVGTGVLIPRADTETVIDVCIEKAQNAFGTKILDLCAGTGCIGITLACELPSSEVTLLEKYEEAARYIKKNIEKNNAKNAHLLMGDIFESAGADQKYSLIVSNPPYVSADEMENLQPELAFEPDTALYGGEDGLLFYRAICENYKDALQDGGTLVFEIGYSQGKAVSEIMKENGFCDVEIRKDLSENDRVVFGTLKSI